MTVISSSPSVLLHVTVSVYQFSVNNWQSQPSHRAISKMKTGIKRFTWIQKRRRNGLRSSWTTTRLIVAERPRMWKMWGSGARRITRILMTTMVGFVACHEFLNEWHAVAWRWFTKWSTTRHIWNILLKLLPPPCQWTFLWLTDAAFAYLLLQLIIFNGDVCRLSISGAGNQIRGDERRVRAMTMVMPILDQVALRQRVYFRWCNGTWKGRIIDWIYIIFNFLRLVSRGK